MIDETPWRTFALRTDPTEHTLVEARRLDSGDWEWRGLTGRADSGIMAPGEFRMTYTRQRLSEIGLAVVRSSNLSAVGYDPATWQLLIEFVGGATYLYDNVDPAIAAPLTTAIGKVTPDVSLGAYFSGTIKPFADRYPYVRLQTALPS